MKVLQYNILDGCTEKDRFDKFSDWMRKQSYDVAGFNEVNEWTKEGFQQTAEMWGYPHSFLFEAESSPYFVGVMSKFPIEVMHTDEENFYHGLIHVKIKGIHFFVMHLTPFSSESREQETNSIIELTNLLRDTPVVVMGDLNTLSPLDKNHYDNVGMNELLLEKEKSTVQHTKNGEINYTPMKILLEGGLHDIGYSESFRRSIPTPLKHDLSYAKQLRIDYMLGNDLLLDYHPDARVIQNQEVEELSDHYPIECYWNDAEE